MVWTINLNKKSKKSLSKLDRQAQIKINNFILKLEKATNPRNLGKALTGNLGVFWRYRVGSYRIICEIKDETITILIVDLGHRKDIYD